MDIRLIALKRFADNKGFSIKLLSRDGLELSVPIEKALKFVAIVEHKIIDGVLECKAALNYEDFMFHFGELI